MSVPLTINGVTFQYPQQFDKNWGPTLTNWSIAVTNALKPLTGGFLSLPYPSSGIVFENSTNTGTLPLTVNSSNQLTFNGIPIGATASLTNGHIYVGNITNNPADVAMTGDVTISNTGVTTLGALKVSNSNIATLAGIALTKLAPTTAYYWYTANSAGVLTPIGVTASKVVITDANGLPSASSVTPTTLAFLDATSSVQTQLNGLLPLSGGTMSGSISMASNKITSLANGTSNGDAVNFGQLPAQSGTITNWFSFDVSIAGCGTITDENGRWRRVGDTMEVLGYFKAGITAASNFLFTIPDGQFINTANLYPRTQMMGDLISMPVSLANVNKGILFYNGSDNAHLYLAQQGASSSLVVSFASDIIGSNYGVTFRFAIPIAGWSI
jgi:hypothetical protein